MGEYTHYIRTNEAGVVTYGFSSAFEHPNPTDIVIESDTGRHYNPVLTNEHGQYLYKVVSGEVVERTQSELDAEWASKPPTPPSIEERTQANEDAINFLLGTVML